MQVYESFLNSIIKLRPNPVKPGLNDFFFNSKIGYAVI